MTLPPDLSEGWYWVRWKTGKSSIERIRADARGVWHIGGLVDGPLNRELYLMTAVERVAPPSWARGE